MINVFFYGKFFVFSVYRKGMDIDLAKSKDIQDMEPPMNCKELVILCVDSLMSVDSYQPV